MRVIFIGIHNKPGMQPLDSKTKSGKNIDAIIANLEVAECVKTNLFDVDKKPLPAEYPKLIDQYFERVKFDHHNDIAVLLGMDVISALANDLRLPAYSVSVGHPSLRFSKYTKEQYVAEVTKLIKSLSKYKLCLQENNTSSKSDMNKSISMDGV